MITSIYELAMYEIINKIRTVCPSYHFDYDDETIGSGGCKALIDELYEYTDNLHINFPGIDDDTYSMVVCGTIMQTFVSNLECNADFTTKYFNKLKSIFADEKTISYFKHIYKAIEVIREFYWFEAGKEIIEWPNDFSFEFDENSEEYVCDYHRELLAAVDDKPSYSYAYCMIAVPFFNSITGIDLDFETSDYRLRKALVKTHKCIGRDLFQFLLNGFFSDNAYLKKTYHDVSENERELQEFSSEIAAYATNQGYGVQMMNDIEIKNGYFEIEGIHYPAGIPFFRHYDTDEFHKLIDATLEFIPREKRDWEPRSNSAAFLTENDDHIIKVKNYPLFAGLSLFMPLYDYYIKETEVEVKKLGMDILVSRFLDVSATEMERLEVVNEELRITNENLNRHIKLNEELVRNLSHSSSNYLNSDRLAKTGFELRNASEGNPPVPRLHSDGLLLLLQSEHETYLRRRLDSLVIRCSADSEKVKKNIREGLSTESGESILQALEFSVKTILSRILTYEEDIRSTAIKEKYAKDTNEWIALRDSFITNVLANDYSAIKWCNENLCQIIFEVTDRWQKVKIIEDLPFFDLVVEILTEQLLNAFSHGDINKPIIIRFNQSDEVMRMGRLRPTWCSIECENKKGSLYKGGRMKGIKTLNATLLLINNNERGFESLNREDSFVSKAWLKENLLRPYKGGCNERN